MFHPTVTLPGPDGPVEIDVELAPVISALWALGVNTRQCCQYSDLSDSAEISFPTAGDMAAFVTAMFPHGADETDELHAKFRDWEIFDPVPSQLRDAWRWIVVPEPDADGRWVFVGQVQFPASDIPTVTERLERVVSTRPKQTP
jgi:hypothetical protein